MSGQTSRTEPPRILVVLPVFLTIVNALPKMIAKCDRNNSNVYLKCSKSRLLFGKRVSKTSETEKGRQASRILFKLP